MNPRSFAALVFWVALSWSASLSGVFFRPGEWYAGLDKPSWTPPDWLFPPVWSALYTLMGVAAWLVWQRRGGRPVGAALGLFVAQLAVNASWSWLFFGLRRPDLGLAGLTVLLALAALTAGAFARVRPLAAALLVPYLLWLSYAEALNVAIWRANGP